MNLGHNIETPEQGTVEMKKNGRRKILVVEDVEINREILKNILCKEYDVVTAENGEVGLNILKKYYRELSIVILDMYMPICDGFEFLKQWHQDALLQSVPVMVTTGSTVEEDEVKCLELGASDFITKPYNNQVVLSRVKSIIRLRESDATLAAVEYDEVTGLYTRPAFNHYAEELLSSSEDKDYSMVVAELDNLNQLESILGERYSEEAIRFYADKFEKVSGVMFGFRKDNQFYFLIEHHSDDPKECMKHTNGLGKDSPYANVIIKYGIYYKVDKSLTVNDICERARLAVNSIRGNFINNYAVYDDQIAKDEQERYLIETSFDQAIANEEFVIWLQPKYSSANEKIHGSEALVRWKKTDGSVVPPGVFIPTYESDGLITRLDEYVFGKVCAMQKERLDKGLPIVRTSINLSRLTLFNENVAEKYAAIVRSYGIPFDSISIELTESFAIENDQVEKLCVDLVNAGFRLDMDDFGSGYSSMSGLVTLPFSVVKLDKALVDRIGEPKGEILIEYAIILAHKLGMSVVAEGVENDWQTKFLENMGCDLIQGYYFSKPVPKEEFFEMLDSERIGS